MHILKTSKIFEKTSCNTIYSTYDTVNTQNDKQIIFLIIEITFLYLKLKLFRKRMRRLQQQIKKVVYDLSKQS